MEPKKHKTSNMQIALNKTLIHTFTAFWTLLRTTLGRTTVVLFLLLRRTSLWNTCEASLEKEKELSTFYVLKKNIFKHWSDNEIEVMKELFFHIVMYFRVISRKCRAETWFNASVVDWIEMRALHSKIDADDCGGQSLDALNDWRSPT